MSKWLNQIPNAARLEVEKKLDKESSDLLLTLQLNETARNPNGFPAFLQACLTDANFTKTFRRWPVTEVADLGVLEEHARQIFLEAGDISQRTEGAPGLRIHIFANTAMLGVPWQSFRIDPADDSDFTVFGEIYSFVLRSRSRALRSDRSCDYDAWRNKSEALRTRAGSQIQFAPAPPWSRTVSDELATIDGLLFFGDVFPATAAPLSNPQKVLSSAIRKGLPLASWRIASPNSASAEVCDSDACHQYMRALFDQAPLLLDAPDSLLKERRSKPWARITALFWDDDEYSRKLLTNPPENPNQL